MLKTVLFFIGLGLMACGGTPVSESNSGHIGWRLRGRVDANTEPGEEIYVVVQRWLDDEWQPLEQLSTDELHTFDIIVDVLWTLRLSAFVDVNGNGLHDQTEPATIADVNLDPATERQYGTRDNIIVSLPRTARLAVALGRPTSEHRSLASGAVLALDADEFGPEAAAIGVERPLHWMREYTAGLFLLEPWRAGSEPVILLHGLGGYGQQFSPMVEALDRSKYQAVVAAYPSGWPLNDVAVYLDRLLDELLVTLDVDRFHIVAHSMGGLIARKTIGYRARRPSVPQASTFVTIASPLGGHPMALAGVRYAPRVVPAWRDLALPSDFLRDLYQQPLPSSIYYLLLYTTEDQSVPLANQQRAAAMREATETVAIQDGHVTVLSNDETFDQVRGALEHGRTREQARRREALAEQERENLEQPRP